MKILFALSVVQIAAILFLLTRVAALDERVQTAVPAEPQTMAQQPAQAVTVPTRPQAAQAGLDEGQLRRIVREELAAQLSALPLAAAGEEALVAAVDPVEKAAMEYRTELVGEEIQFYVSRGTISDVEMQNLQGEIAKLDKEGQKKMLGQLVRALNSGELKGRL